MLQIFNNFLSDEDLIEFNNIIDKSQWKYEGFSVKRDNMFWKMSLKDEQLLNKIINRLELSVDKKFKLIETYANGQTHNQDGEFHTDATEMIEYTLLLYISEITPMNIDRIGGYTQFVINNSIREIEPYVKRAVFFDSRILHRGMAPLTKNMLRVSIALKLKEIK